MLKLKVQQKNRWMGQLMDRGQIVEASWRMQTGSASSSRANQVPDGTHSAALKVGMQSLVEVAAFGALGVLAAFGALGVVAPVVLDTSAVEVSPSQQVARTSDGSRC